MECRSFVLRHDHVQFEVVLANPAALPAPSPTPVLLSMLMTRTKQSSALFVSFAGRRQRTRREAGVDYFQPVSNQLNCVTNP
jgi:hypothetical protein